MAGAAAVCALANLAAANGPVSASTGPARSVRASGAALVSAAPTQTLDSLLAQAADKAGLDVTALTAELAAAKTSDTAAAEAARDQVAALAAERDAASDSAKAAETAATAADLEIERLKTVGTGLESDLAVEQQRLSVRRSNFRIWLAEAYISEPMQIYAPLIASDTLAIAHKGELVRTAGDVLKDAMDTTEKKIKSIKRDIADNSKLLNDTVAKAASARSKNSDETGRAADAEQRRLAAVAAEAERKQSADLAQFVLSLRITQAGEMTNKFRLLGIDSTTTINGAPLLSGVDLARFFLGYGKTARLTVTITELARLFEQEGKAEGIRSDIAFAQSILETGYFSFPSYGQLEPGDNNYAGIGACDSCANGFGFPSAELGVRAQMQLLKIYANPTLTSADFANPSARFTPERIGVRGCCQTWAQLAGVWASSTAYFGSISSVWNTIVRWVATDYIKNGPPGVVGFPDTTLVGSAGVQVARATTSTTAVVDLSGATTTTLNTGVIAGAGSTLPPTTEATTSTTAASGTTATTAPQTTAPTTAATTAATTTSAP